ncbi:hypothetical protein [Streptomyces sp. NPDC000994]
MIIMPVDPAELPDGSCRSCEGLAKAAHGNAAGTGFPRLPTRTRLLGFGEAPALSQLTDECRQHTQWRDGVLGWDTPRQMRTLRRPVLERTPWTAVTATPVLRPATVN